MQFDRVLGREDHEWVLEVKRLPCDRDLPLLHRFEQGGLHLGRGAVDLVGEDDVREDRALLDLEVAGGLIEHWCPDDVRGQQVGRELDPSESGVDRFGQGPHHQCLGQTGKTFEQDVPSGQ